MRQIIIKKKKKIKVHRYRRMMKRVLAASAAAVFFILAGTTLTVYGSEEVKQSAQAPREVITQILHKHAGSSIEQGGCYSVPVLHQHEGDEKSGGVCYQTPVFHNHIGNENESGGCYTKPVYHEHQGDEQQGGGCYEEITHIHGAECYQQADCLMNHAPDGNILETWTDTCFGHGQTTFGKSKGIATHMDCGKGEEERIYRYCLTCGSVSPSLHSYQKLVCQTEEGTVTGYERNCGKDETTIDGYETSCGFEEAEIEGYLISCQKKIDGYAAGCGLNENQLCGRVILRNETEGKAQQAVLSVCLEDLTGGQLKLCVPAYEWRDESGRLIGSGEKIEVNENGKYSILVKLENKDVQEAGLCSSILIDNIEKENASPSPEASPSSKTPLPTSTPKTQTETAPEEHGNSLSEESSSNNEERKALVPQAREIANTAASEEAQEEFRTVGRTKKAFIPEKIEGSPLPEKPPVIKESRIVEAEEFKAPMEEVTVKESRENPGIFSTRAVRVIAISGGAALFLFAMVLLLIYLRRSVSVFNDNGEGRMLFLGRCMVKYENSCYGIVISQAMEEKAWTNRYCIKPGLFRIGKKEGEELIITKGNKSITAYLEKEMIVML